MVLVVVAAWVGFVAWRKRGLRRQYSKLSSHDLYVRTWFHEHQFLARKALELALYRTYAVPSISKLLASTQQFEEQCAKRYDDTDVLVATALVSCPGSEAHQLSCARINQIHGMYRTISMEDMRYVLSVFVTVPQQWIYHFGARELSPAEVQASVETINSFGRALGITDLPGNVQAWTEWQEGYEAQHMHHAPSNEEVGEATTLLLLSKVPRLLHPLARAVLVSFMDERLRIAMGLPKPNPVLKAYVWLSMKARQQVWRWLVLPATHYRGRIDLGICPVAGRTLKYRYHVYEDTYPDGYQLHEVGPAKCPVLQPEALVQEWCADSSNVRYKAAVSAAAPGSGAEPGTSQQV